MRCVRVLLFMICPLGLIFLDLPVWLLRGWRARHTATLRVLVLLYLSILMANPTGSFRTLLFGLNGLMAGLLGRLPLGLIPLVFLEKLSAQTHPPLVR